MQSRNCTASSAACHRGLNPDFIPSRSIEVSKFTAPFPVICANSTINPWVYGPVCEQFPFAGGCSFALNRRQCIGCKMIGCLTDHIGFSRAAGPKHTLSAPANRRARILNRARHLTVRGMACSAVRRTISNIVPRFSWVAWMSKNKFHPRPRRHIARRPQRIARIAQADKIHPSPRGRRPRQTGD